MTITIDDKMFSTLPVRPLLRVDEVAAFFSITKRTVYSWYESDKLTGCNVNGTIRIYRTSVVELVISTNGKKNGLFYPAEVEEKICETKKPRKRGSGWVRNY